MRHIKHIVPLIICFLAVGCATTGGPSKDPVVIAEHAMVDGKITFDSFVHLEAINRDMLMTMDPSIHKYAETIRKNGPIWLQSAYDLTQAYKKNSSEANLVNLRAIVATITEAVTQSSNYVGRINTAAKPN